VVGVVFVCVAVADVGDDVAVGVIIPTVCICYIATYMGVYVSIVCVLCVCMFFVIISMCVVYDVVQ